MAKNGNTEAKSDYLEKGKGRGSWAMENCRDENILAGAGDDSNRIAQFNMELYDLDPVDMTNSEAVDNRVKEYVRLCAKYNVKPGVSGLGFALGGVDRRRLWEMNNDVPGRNVNIPKATRDVVKRSYALLESLWESYLLGGKVNPVSLIFYGKNYFGHRDHQEIVVSPGIGQEDAFNEQDIASRYIAPPTTIEGEFAE